MRIAVLRLAAAVSGAVMIGMPARAQFSFVENLATGMLNAPFATATDALGNVYVADMGNHRIVRFNPSNVAGTFTTFGSLGSGIGQFFSPMGITLDSVGNVFVSDASNARIVRFDPNNFTGSFTTFGGPTAMFGQGTFYEPRQLLVDGVGNVIVADHNNKRVVRFNQGDFLGTFTSFESTMATPFHVVTGVARDAMGNIYASVDSSHALIRFDPNNFVGSFTTIGAPGSGVGEFSTPLGMATDILGRFYVADANNQRIVQFDPNNFLGSFRSFGSVGSGNGQFNVPTSVSVTNGGDIFVVDTQNDRISHWHTSMSVTPEAPGLVQLLPGLLPLGIVLAKRRRHT